MVISNRVIWHVKVFLEDKTEDYYFWDKAHVMDSIYLTYSKCMNSIKIIEKGMNITVRSTDRFQKVHLIAQQTTVSMLIQNSPTHF